MAGLGVGLMAAGSAGRIFDLGMIAVGAGLGLIPALLLQPLIDKVILYADVYHIETVQLFSEGTWQVGVARIDGRILSYELRATQAPPPIWTHYIHYLVFAGVGAAVRTLQNRQPESLVPEGAVP